MRESQKIVGSMGIWRFEQLNDFTGSKISLGEGDTSLEKTSLENTDVFIKHEEENPNNSFKDRSLVYQLSYYLGQGKKNFAISSSGNAAISAASVITKSDARLHIFVSDKLAELKLHKLKNFESERIIIKQSPKPSSDCIKFCNAGANSDEIINLRGSKDELAVKGFKSIAYELTEQLPNIDAIFIPCSSGTSTVGIAQGFKEMRKQVKIQIVQTSEMNQIARDFHRDLPAEERSLATAITDRIASRKSQVQKIVRESAGFAWIASNSDLEQADQLIYNLSGNHYSYNSLLSVAGYLQARQSGMKFKAPVLLFSGI